MSVPTGKLVEAILYVIKTLQPKDVTIGAARVQKLLYLADHIAKRKLGHTITGVTYRYGFFGPYAEAIRDTLYDLVAKKLLKDTPLLTRFGIAHRYALTIQEGWVPKTLTEDELKVLDRVLTKYGTMNLFDILDIAYSTEPLQHAYPNEVLKL